MARQPRYRWPLTIGLIFAVIIAVLIVTATWSVRALFKRTVFQPSTSVVNDLDAFGLHYSQLTLSTGETVQVVDHLVTDSPYIILFFHGNAGNISTNVGMMHLLVAMGYSYALIDYPGYGMSTGHPNESNLYASGEALYQFAQDQGYQPDQIIIFGQSLGGGVAVELAHDQPARALIIMSTLASTDSAIQDKQLAPWVTWLTSNWFDNATKIQNVQAPILLIHGTADEVLPFHQSELLQAANAKATLLSVKEANHHNVIDVYGREALASEIDRWISNH